MARSARSRYSIPRGSNPDGSFRTDEPLARVGVALMVLHFHVLGHRDSWGSCLVCQEICDRVAPEHQMLRVANTKLPKAAEARPTNRWTKAALDTIDPTLFGRLVGPRGHYSLRSTIPIRYGQPLTVVPETTAASAEAAATTWPRARSLHHLTEDDFEVVLAAINSGRFFPKEGMTSVFRHNPRDKGSAHHSGGSKYSECSECTKWTRQVVNNIDRRADLPAKGEPDPKGRLRALAQFLQYRTSIVNIASDSFEREHVDQAMPAKPGADLPDCISMAIDNHPARLWPTTVYLAVIKQLKYWATDVDPDAACTHLPFSEIGSRIVLADEDRAAKGIPEGQPSALTARQVSEAWDFIQQACAQHPDSSAQAKLQEHLLNHLHRRLGGGSLETVGEDGCARVRPDVAAAYARSEVLESPLVKDTRDRLRLDWDRPLNRITRSEVEKALMEVLADLLPEREDHKEELEDQVEEVHPNAELIRSALRALDQSDPAEAALTRAFQDLVTEVERLIEEERHSDGGLGVMSLA